MVLNYKLQFSLSYTYHIVLFTIPDWAWKRGAFNSSSQQDATPLITWARTSKARTCSTGSPSPCLHIEPGQQPWLRQWCQHGRLWVLPRLPDPVRRWEQPVTWLCTTVKPWRSELQDGVLRPQDWHHWYLLIQQSTLAIDYGDQIHMLANNNVATLKV